MSTQTGVTLLFILFAVAIIWFLLGFAIYGGGRGKNRRGGIFWAVYRFMVTPFLITSAMFGVFFGIFWVLAFGLG